MLLRALDPPLPRRAFHGGAAPRGARASVVDWRLPLGGKFARALNTCCLLLLLFTYAAAQTAPPAPTDVQLLHRSGQTFLTFDELPQTPGARYRVYRSDQPFDESSLAQASLLVELPVDSGVFYPERYRTTPSGDEWAVRHFERYVIEDLGDELSPGRGLWVWTPDASDLGGATNGLGYYAVTSVLDGVESTSLWPSGAASAVAESVDEPLPVLAKTSSDGLAHVLLQYFDQRATNASFFAPHALFDHYGLDPLSPALDGAQAYALSYVLAEPPPAIDPPSEPLPLVLLLHGHAKGSYPANLTHTTNHLPALELRPTDVGETWWFGYARDHDFRLGGVPSVGDAIRNFTEERVLRMLRDLGRMPSFASRIDPARTYVYGASMGGTGALAFAQRFPDVFAASYASVPMTDFAQSGTSGGVDWKVDVEPKWGQLALDLGVEIVAPEGWADHLQPAEGTGVWQWMNLLADFERRPAARMAPFGVAHGLQDQVVEWGSQGAPTYVACDSARRSWGGKVIDIGHIWTFFEGLPPTLGKDANDLPWRGLTVVRDETLPGLSHGSADAPLPPLAPGAWNALIEWSASWDAWDDVPVDQSESWSVSLRSTDGTALSVDVTPRRVQQFQTDPLASYLWEARSVLDDSLLLAVKCTSDVDGLVSMQSVPVDSNGTRLSLRPANYELSVAQLVAGGTAEFEVQDASPDTWQWCVVGLPGSGSFEVPVLGISFDMGMPILLQAIVADAAGAASWSKSVPSGLTGLQLALQVAEFDSKTPLAIATIQ